MLRRDEKALQEKYNFYWWFSAIAVCLGIVVPILAGSTLLQVPPFKSAWWTPTAGVLVLLASVMTALHRGLNCEAYHATCRKVLMSMHGLILAYGDLANDPPKDPGPAFAELEARLAELYDGAADVISVQPTPIDVAGLKRRRPKGSTPNLRAGRTAGSAN